MTIKKLFPVFLVSLFILSACAPLTNLVKRAARDQSSASTSISSSERESSSEEASSSSSDAESQKVVSRTFTGKEDEYDRTDTVTYQGDTFLTLKVVALGDFPAEAKQSLDNLGRETFSQVWQEALQNEEQVIKAKELEGFELTYEVSEDNRMKMTMVFDMQKLDADKASQIAMLKEMKIKEIKATRPTLYIASLKFNSFKEVK